MITMQYHIQLPGDYDMNIIKERVKNNGFKTDGFPDLKWKVYLIREKDKNGSFQNEYAPLYLWKTHDGMNRFLFEGFYDNILTSFGWQSVQINIPILDTTTEKIQNARYVVEFTHTLKPSASLQNVASEMKNPGPLPNANDEMMICYNPEQWKYSIFYFLDNLDDNVLRHHGKVYTVLHVSQS